MDTKTPENKKNSPRLKVLIIILSVLLVLSAGGLAAKYVYDNFFADVTGQTKQLGNVLEIKVTRVGEDTALCDLPFSEADGREYKTSVAENGSGVTAVYYRIDVSLDTSVGNEYQAAELTADFKWFVKDESALESPVTGDAGGTVLWALLAASSAALIILLPVYRKGDKKREEA